MEEKERYIYKKIDGYYWIKDTETNENYCVNNSIVKLLNQQDKHIKELGKMSSLYLAIENRLWNEVKRLRQEKQQLKQSQKELAISELEKVKEKERYKLIYNDEEQGYAVIDTQEDLSANIHYWNILCDLLNQQDKRIKELEKMSISTTKSKNLKEYK